MQIYELILSRIASSEWAEEQRIPSVRELGATLVVNPNTVMRTYERLTDEGLIFNRRGIGYFVAEGAKNRAAAIAQERFISEQLPSLFAKMKSIGITADEILTLYQEYENK
jgi:DNA-binding transcriptional regulator YhcF (GntR family)